MGSTSRLELGELDLQLLLAGGLLVHEQETLAPGDAAAHGSRQTGDRQRRGRRAWSSSWWSSVARNRGRRGSRRKPSPSLSSPSDVDVERQVFLRARARVVQVAEGRRVVAAATTFSPKNRRERIGMAVAPRHVAAASDPQVVTPWLDVVRAQAIGRRLWLAAVRGRLAVVLPVAPGAAEAAAAVRSSTCEPAWCRRRSGGRGCTS